MTTRTQVRRPAPARILPKPIPGRGTPVPWLKPGIIIGSLAPLASIIWRASENRLGANPIAQAINELGLAALVLLIASLACTPAKRVLGWTWPIRVRRELGLLAFFYASLHFLTYLIIDHALDLGVIVEDVVKRPFITAGFAALVLLVPLALTSTKDSIRKLGFMRWQKLHYLVYAAGGLAVLHFIWRVKLDVTQPMTYAVIFLVLLGVRGVYWWWKQNQAV